MPGPVLLGSIIDSSCKIWQESCGVQGSCWVYDKSSMATRLVLWFMGLKVLGFVMFLIASLVYKPPQAGPTETVATIDIPDSRDKKTHDQNSPYNTKL